MHPLGLFILGLFSPLLLAATLLVPLYCGIAVAAYIIYAKTNGANPLHDKIFDLFYMIDVYARLFKQWSQHMQQSDFLNYTAPLLVVPFLGLLTAFWLTRKMVRMLKKMFHHGL